MRPIRFEEPEIHWVAMMIDSGHEDIEAFRAGILDSLRPQIDDGERIIEMWTKVFQMNDAETVRLMAEAGRLGQASDRWTNRSPRPHKRRRIAKLV